MLFFTSIINEVLWHININVNGLLNVKMILRIFKIMYKIIKQYKFIWIGCIAFFSIIIIWTVVIEPQMITIKRDTIEIPGFHKDSEIKIAVISDLHIGIPYMDLNRLKKIVVLVNEENPDVIVNLGDYHSHAIAISNISFEDISKVLNNLKAKYGNYTILGNHDGLHIQHKWLDGRFQTLEYQRKLIVDMINNSNTKLLDDSYDVVNVRDDKFVLLGLTDCYSTTENYIELYLANNLQPAHYLNLEKIMPTIPEGLPVILLNHSPDIFPQVSERIALTLSGHTHGAHMNLPGFREMVVPSIYPGTYIKGHYQEGKKQLYISPGLGGPPVRLGVSPEIVILTLKGKDK